MKIIDNILVKTDGGKILLEKDDNIKILNEEDIVKKNKKNSIFEASSDLLNLKKSLATALLLIETDKDRAKQLVAFAINILDNHEI